ncbi:MOSC and FAD-binding oxidoreductase domain-containing protein [Streptomyces griseoaurantiacus]|uniref:MOSC and FAD-binding oxidoreductase domain-containing protein n=1 Tax=Streptomyces griseoaurantiacus TaxID=68213 RepID=UPI002ED6733D|nr:MOSC and FAD-binding oxidoreductase domain-containing protein [Streptomyces jietaisiensis]
MATLIAVNVGMPQDVPWRGRTTHTGIWKRPVAGPRMVRRLNIDGDGQGDLKGHGGPHRAVLVYQSDSYRYWREHLGRDDFVHGQFGENFTVEGLADDEVCIGDRYRIGEALFEVTQPRVTCYRVGLRMDEPRMPALLVAHGRPGFYLKVLTEGVVEAGDEIVRTRTGPEAMTVREIDALLYTSAHPRPQLERALRIPALSPGWKQSMRSLLDDRDTGVSAGNSGLTGVSAAPPPAWQGFRTLEVTRITAESADVFSLVLRARDGSPLPPALPGQFVTVRMWPDPRGAPVVRSYSLSGPPGDGTYRISVKQERHGVGSGHLHRHVALHDTLEVAAPRGDFVLRDTPRPVVLLSAGVGATPVLAMLHHLAATRDTRPVWWIHGARDGGERPFRQEVRALLAELPAGHCHIAYSRPREADTEGSDYQSAGRVTPELLRSLDLPAEAETYLCGPLAFMDGLTSALAEDGVDPSRIHTETFGSASAITPGIVPADRPAPHLPTAPPGPSTGPSVTFARSNLTVPWHAGYGTLLELAEACDVPVRWSCRTGVCHTCETALVAGRVAYRLDPIDPPPKGDVLICCSEPTGDVLLDL